MMRCGIVLYSGVNTEWKRPSQKDVSLGGAGVGAVDDDMLGGV